MSKKLAFCFLLVLMGSSISKAQQPLIFRDGIVVFRNNEALKGEIAIREYQKKYTWISILPQGSANYIRIKPMDILKMEFIYGNPHKIYQQATGLNSWVSLYKNNGQSYGLCYFNSYSIHYKNYQGQIRVFLIQDGMESIENINTIKTILFYPSSESMEKSRPLTDLSVPASDLKSDTVVHPESYSLKLTRKTSYFRSKPDGIKIGKLNKNFPVKVIEKNGSWEKIQLEGWIHESLLRDQDTL